MKIVICGSMLFSKEMMEVAKELERGGHGVTTPHNADKYASEVLKMELNSSESIENKIKDDLIKDYFNKIKNADAVLILNIEKNGIDGYIGGNSFLEMAFAHVLDKKIYLYNDIPDMSYTDEIIAMQSIMINQNLNKIK